MNARRAYHFIGSSGTDIVYNPQSMSERVSISDRCPSPGEEIANSISHGVGLALAIAFSTDENTVYCALDDKSIRSVKVKARAEAAGQ